MNISEITNEKIREVVINGNFYSHDKDGNIFDIEGEPINNIGEIEDQLEYIEEWKKQIPMKKKYVIETTCPWCGAHIEEVTITQDDDEIVCTACEEYVQVAHLMTIENEA